MPSSAHSIDCLTIYFICGFIFWVANSLHLRRHRTLTFPSGSCASHPGRTCCPWWLICRNLYSMLRWSYWWGGWTCCWLVWDHSRWLRIGCSTNHTSRWWGGWSRSRVPTAWYRTFASGSPGGFRYIFGQSRGTPCTARDLGFKRSCCNRLSHVLEKALPASGSICCCVRLGGIGVEIFSCITRELLILFIGVSQTIISLASFRPPSFRAYHQGPFLSSFSSSLSKVSWWHPQPQICSRWIWATLRVFSWLSFLNWVRQTPVFPIICQW